MPQLTRSQFTGIFVSYRRDDCAGHAGRLYDTLVAHFGEDHIFMDVDTIEPGEDFVEVIESAVASCEVLIAVIGRQWLSRFGESARLLENPNDFVRMEVAAALKRDIRVIPVMVQRATMPSPKDLPEDLLKLSSRNALELSDYRWQFDVEELVRAVEEVGSFRLKTEEEARAHPPASSTRINKRTMLIAIIAGVAVLAIGTFIFMRSTPRAGEQQTASQKIGEPAGASTNATTPQPPPGMVYVPGAKFQMGHDVYAPSQTEPVTKTLEPFFLDLYEVTCEQYKKFLEVDPNQVAPPDWENRNYPTGWARKPVTGVNWDQASAFAVWSGKRLPMEEEWEYAARGTDGRLFPWGRDWKPGLANTGKPEAGPLDGASGMAEVGSHKGTSPFGAYDMIGNAWEWTGSDFKSSSADSAPSGSKSSHDVKVIRGGSWASRNDQATTLFRRGYGARGEQRGYSYTGFRLVRDISNSTSR
ncbi:MAG: SUMF1/EgtB/PvdO family nonheme iron enzyme [Pyrinomonadaceae bacterium]